MTATTLESGAHSLAKGVTEGFKGINFGEAIKDTVKHCKFGLKSVYTDSFVKAVKAIANSKVAGKAALATVALSTVFNGIPMLYSGVDVFEDLRRINNISSESSDLLTPQRRAKNLLYMSGAAATLSFVPAFAGISELTGSSLINTAGSEGISKTLGHGLKTVGKGLNLVTSGFLKAGGLVGSGIDKGVNLVSSLLGSSFQTKGFSKLLGKQFIFIHALLLGRMAYKWNKIDRTKRPNDGLAALNIGGVGVFIDNDPSSPTYLQSTELASARAERAAEKELFGAGLGRTLRSLVG